MADIKKIKIGSTTYNISPSWNNITGKPSTYPPDSHTHTKSEVGLGNVDNTADANKNVNYANSAGSANYFKYGRGVILADSTSFTNNFNKDIFGDETDTKFHLVELRTQGNAPSCLIGQHSSGIAWKGGDTYGSLMVRWGYPQIRVSGGNGNNTNPKWTVDLIHSNNISSESIKYATTGGGMGYYDTITKNSDGTFTITRQTGYLTINTEDITRGSNETVNSAKTYVYAYSSKKVSDALYDWDAIIGISNNGFEVKCVDSDWISANKISINSRANQICIGFSSQKTQAEIQALCPIYVQYKLATATTEKVEERHYARYNQRFILEHNKSEAERSANLWDLEQNLNCPNSSNISYEYLQLQTFNDDTYVSNLGEFTWNSNSYLTFTKTSNYNKIRIVRNGDKSYITIKEIYCATLGITNDNTYTLSLFNNRANMNDSFTISNIMLNEGQVALPYQPYNQSKHITNNEAVFLKTETDRSANLWDEITESGTLSGDDGSLENNSARLRSKNFIPISGNTRYIFNLNNSQIQRINFYDSSTNFINTLVYPNTSFVTPDNAYYMKFDIHSNYGTTYKKDIILNKGNVILDYQPYEGKVIHEKDLKNASTNLGYYDTITENTDGSYTITKQTGYINGTDFLNWGVNGAGNRYVTFEHIKVNNNIENIIGNCGRVGSYNWWQNTFSQVTITYDANNDFLIILLPYGTAENDSSPLNDIHVQYKLPNTRTEKVEKNYCAQYNQRFILEHNKSEAERSANVFNKDLPTLIYGTGYEVPTTVNDWVKVYQVPVKGNTVYSSNKEMTVYASSDGVTYTGIGAGVTTFTTSSNTKYLCFCIYVGTNNATISSSIQTFSDLMLNEGQVALPYQPYEGKVVHMKDLENLPKLYYHFLEILDGLSYYEVYIISTWSDTITNYYALRNVAGAAINVPKDNTIANGDEIITFRLNASGRYHNGNEAYYVLSLDVMMSQNTAYDKIIVTYNNAGNFIRSNKNLLSSATFKDKVTPIYGGQ